VRPGLLASPRLGRAGLQPLQFGVSLVIVVLCGAMRAAQERLQATAAEVIRRPEKLQTTHASSGIAVLGTNVEGRVVS
jgi:hypothetical protein